MDDFRPTPPPRSPRAPEDGAEAATLPSDAGDEPAVDDRGVVGDGPSTAPQGAEPSAGAPSDGAHAAVVDADPPDPPDRPAAPAAAPGGSGGETPWKRVDKRLWIAGAVGLVVVVALAVAFLGGSGTSHTLHGTIALVAPGDLTGTSGDCRGKNEFADFAAGMVVTVDDGTGKVLGTGTTRNVGATGDAGSTSVVRCVLGFDVGVSDASEYRVTIGKRGTQTYSRADLDADGWKVVFNLG